MPIMDLSGIGSAVKAGAVVRPLATRILDGPTAAEDKALRSAIWTSLVAAIEGQQGAEALAEVLFRRFLDKGTMQLVVDQRQLAQGVSGAEEAWARLLSQVIDDEDGLDYRGIDLPRLCTDFAGNLWQSIQHEATRHESPLANLANRLQLAELTNGFRLSGAREQADEVTGLQVALPRSVFVGRELDMSELDDRLEKDRVVFVTGHPGVGKSELTAQWATEQPGRVGWIDASSISSFRAGVEDFARALGVDRLPTVDDTLKALLALKDVCLVLDDAGPDVAAKVAGSRVDGRVVVTSVSAPLEYASFGLELEPLTKASLVSLVLRLLPRLEQVQAETVAELFPGQPLGIRQAAPLIDLMGLDRFTDVLQESPAAGQGMGTVPGRRENMAALWEHSLARLRDIHADGGRRALGLLRVLGGFAVPLDLFLSCVAVELAKDGESLADKAQCWDLIHDARNLRLIDVESGWVRAHGLLRNYCWDTLGGEARDNCLTSAITALAYVLGFMGQEGGPESLMLLDFVANVPRAADEGQPMPKNYEDMLAGALDLAVAHGQREFSLWLVDQGIAAVAKEGDQTRVPGLIALKLRTLESLASPQSLPLIEEYATTIDSVSTPWVRSTFHAQATRAYLRYDQMTSAREHAAAALEAAQAVVDEDEQGIALLMANRVYARVEARDGNLGLAERHFDDAVRLAENAPGGARVVLEIAKSAMEAYTKLDHMDLAQKWREVLLDRVGSSPAGTKYEVALILGHEGRLPEALKLLDAYLAEMDLFDNDSAILRKVEVLNDAGKLCLDNLSVDDGKEYLERARDLLSSVKHLHSSVPHQADVLLNLANCALAEGDFPHSARLAVEAMALDAAYYGKEHHEYAESLLTLASAQYFHGLHKPAFVRLRQAMAIWERPGASQDLRKVAELRTVEQQWRQLSSKGGRRLG